MPSTRSSMCKYAQTNLINDMLSRFEDNMGSQYMVTAVQMFKAGVKPAWEDPVNAKGSEFRIEVKVFNSNDVI